MTRQGYLPVAVDGSASRSCELSTEHATRSCLKLRDHIMIDEDALEVIQRASVD